MEREGNARILIVDDHEDNVELLRARLEAWGYKTDCAMDGASARTPKRPPPCAKRETRARVAREMHARATVFSRPALHSLPP